MIVGFTIKGSSIASKDKKSVIEFLVGTYILQDRSIAENIVSEVMNGNDVNVFGENIDSTEVSKQPFTSKMISVTEGKHLLVSAVDFKLELHYNGGLLILEPTEYKEVSYEEALTYSQEVEQSLIRFFPPITESDSSWILFNGSWTDSKKWVDPQTWKY